MEVDTRDTWIDTLRGVSILLVLLHHFNIAYPLGGTWLGTILGWPVLQPLARNGNYGVTMFFVISGFLITRHALDRWGSLDRIRLKEFYVLRLARILPALLLLLVVVDTHEAGGRSGHGGAVPGMADWPKQCAGRFRDGAWDRVAIDAQAHAGRSCARHRATHDQRLRQALL
jgi:hypothetical protein